MKKRKILFKVRSGSHLYGLNTPESDEDFVSVFMPLPEDLYGLNKCEEIDNSTKSSSSNRRNTKDDVDDKSYSLTKFVHLLFQNNPNILELLFADPKNIIECDPVFKVLIDNYDKIVSQRIIHSFGGYAFSQKKMLQTKKERYDSLKQGVQFLETKIFQSIDWVHNPPKDSHFDNFLEEVKKGIYLREITQKEADEFNKSLKYYKGSKENCESFHSGMELGMIYRHLFAELNRYGWRVKTDTFEKLGYDVKFGYHLIRLMMEGVYLLTEGKISYPFSGSDKEVLMMIRNGEVGYNELMAMHETYESILSKCKDKTTLRVAPDYNFANNYLISTITKYIKEAK